MELYALAGVELPEPLARIRLPAKPAPVRSQVRAGERRADRSTARRRARVKRRGGDSR
jgi:hypothetical protein